MTSLEMIAAIVARSEFAWLISMFEATNLFPFDILKRNVDEKVCRRGGGVVHIISFFS